MNQKLLCVLTAAALGMPAMVFAQNYPIQQTPTNSGVTLVGNLNVEYYAVKIKQAQTASPLTGVGANNRYQTAIGDPSFFSRWGILINEDLGNGLSAIGKIDFAVSPGAGVPEVAREQWIGLSSKTWGTVNIGSVNAPFKVFAGGASVDRFIGTELQLRGSGGAQYSPPSGFGTGGFIDSGINYTSPVFNGFSVGLVFAPGNATQNDATTALSVQRNGNTGGKGNGVDYQVAVKYNIPNYGDVFAGYSQDNASDNQRAQGLINGKLADDETVWRIGANLKFGDFGIYGQYDHISNALNGFSSAAAATGPNNVTTNYSGNGAATCAGGSANGSGGDAGSTTQQCNNTLNVNGDGNIWSLGVSYALGRTLLVVQGGETTADAVGAANKRTAKNITLGAIYQLSKRTRFHVGYQHVSVEGAHTLAQNTVQGTAVTGTAVTSQTGGALPVLAVQPDRSVFSMGMRHTF